MSDVRVVRLLVAVAMATGVAVAPGTGFAAGGPCRAIETAPGGWSAGPLPPPPSLPSVTTPKLAAMTVVGQDPAVAVATDGIAVYRTTDGGCTWKTTYTLGPADYDSVGGDASAYSITNIANGHDQRPAGKQDVYLALSPNSLNAFSLVTLFGFAPPELFAVSHDGGQSFAIETPQPTTTNPLVPECLSAPSTFLAAPTDSKTLYMLCGAGAGQQIVESELAPGAMTMYRSTDSGLSWTLIGLPYWTASLNSAWFAAGVHKDELWIGGYSVIGEHIYLTVWRSTTGGKTWTALVPDRNPVVGGTAFSVVLLGIDSAPGAGFGQIVAFSSAGTYVSADSGKHWRRMRAVTFSNGSRPPAAGFFLHHVLYILFAGEIACKGEPVLVRYPKPTAKPVASAFPLKWGVYASWATDATFAVVGHGLVALGVANFCQSEAGGAANSKLLSLRVR